MNFFVGPTPAQFSRLGLRKGVVYILTAYYSRAALDSLAAQIFADQIFIGVRLDTANLEDWFSGFIDPDALLDFVTGLAARGISVHLRFSRRAHAKMYVGSNAAIVGSANLTASAFAGALEIIARCGPGAVSAARKCAKQYFDRLADITAADLRAFVEANRARVVAEQQRRRAAADTVAEPDWAFGPNRSSAGGTYTAFLRWLGKQKWEAADETLKRARGKNNLTGHIRANFYGLRQFLSDDPDLLKRYAAESPDRYRLSRDAAAEERLTRFVKDLASDEDDFSVETWKTYLPIECGGRAPRHGGTIGNLNRMLPLLSRYLLRQS